jgi:hypothetical protein
MEGIDQHIQSINSWATELGIDYYILDPVSSGDSFVDSLRGRTSTCGESLEPRRPSSPHSGWIQRHCRSNRGLKELIDGKDEAGEDGSVTTESSSSKRARLDSVVTRPMAPPARQGNCNNRAYRMASWLQGRNAPPMKGGVFRAKNNWRGHGGNYGARASSLQWRGRGHRAYRGRW